MSLRVAVVGYPLLAERQWRLYANLADDVEVHLLVPRAWPTIADGEHPESEGPLTVHHYRTAFQGHLMRYLMAGLVRTVRQLDPDVALTHGEPWAAVTASVEAACELTDTPHVVFSWENLERVPHSRLARRLERSMLGAIDATIAGSDAARNRLRARGFEGRVTVAPQTGVDTDRFRPVTVDEERYEEFGIDPDRPVVLYAGRFASEKGVEDLLNAVPAVQDHHPGVQFLLVGGGELTDRLRDQFNPSATEAITLVTEKQPYDAMPAVHSMATVFVYPSRTTDTWAEQFGYSVAEAMACEVPVVTTECGSLPYVVGDGGVVCPERDPDALGAAIADLLADPDRRDRLGVAGRRRVEDEFTLSAVGEQHYRALRSAAREATSSE
jgi:glycosyltransferase involved in cell wall biosynthesis